MSGYRAKTGIVTQFSDPLNGAAGPLNPNNWAQGIIALTPVVAPVSWGSNFLDGTNGTTNTQGTANPNTQLFNYSFPHVLMAGVNGLSQFCQLTFRSATGTANNRWGPVVNFRPSMMPNGYWLRYINAGPLAFDLVREALNGAGTPGTSLNEATLVAGIGGPLTLLNGDVIRLSVDMTNVAAPVLTVKVNGVVRATFTDNIAPLNQGGCPAILSTLHDGVISYSNFSAGVGL